MTLEAGISVGGGMPFLGNQFEINTEIQFVHDLGATWVRFDLHWDTVETADGTFSGWSVFDKMWAAAKEFNLKVLWIVHHTPSWARGGAGTNLTYPTTVSHYGDFCAVAAARYPGCAWEFWNEPNGNWAAADVSTTGAQKLASMIADASPKIRAADSTAILVGPGILRLGTAGSATFRLDTEYLGDMYAGDLDPGDLDYLGFHPYNNDPHLDPTDAAATNGWNRVDDYTLVARAAGDTTIKTWITEVGYHTYTGAASRPGASEAQQATYLASAFTVWKALSTSGYVDGPLFWYQTKDSESTYSNAVGEGAYGLIKNDRITKKAAYTTYQTEAAALYANTYRFRLKAIRNSETAFEDVEVLITAGSTVSATMAAPLGALTGAISATVQTPVVATMAAPLGSLNGAVTAVVDHPATFAAPLGALAGAVTATVTHPATMAAPLGALTAGATATKTVAATAAAPLGALAGAVTAVRQTAATAAAPLGALTATAAAGRVVDATVAAPLGALTATATGTPVKVAAFAAPLGGLNAGSGGGQFATVTKTVTMAAPLGALTASMAATQSTPSSGVPATMAANLGTLAAAAALTVAHLATLDAQLDELAASMSATRSTPFIGDAPLGELTAGVSADRTIDATFDAALGVLVATMVVFVFTPGALAAERTLVIAQDIRSLVVLPQYRRLIVPPAVRSTIGH